MEDIKKGTDSNIIADTASEQLNNEEFKADEKALQDREKQELGKTSGQQFLDNRDENKDYQKGSTADKTKNEIDNATAENSRDKANKALKDTLEQYRKNTGLDKDSIEKSKKYAENIGNNLYSAYRSGSFGEPGSKEARNKFATLLTNHVGTMLYNIGSSIKGSDKQSVSDFQKMTGNDLSAAMERKNKADEQELEKNIRDQYESEEDYKAVKDAVNELRKDEIFGAYSAKMDAKTKIWAAEAQAQYGKFFQENPEVSGHIAAAVTSGNPEYIAKTIDAVDDMKNMNAEEAMALKQDIVRNMIEQAVSRGIKTNEALYDYLVRFDVANKVGIKNAKELAEFNIEQARGTFFGRLRRGAEGLIGNAANKAVDKVLK